MKWKGSLERLDAYRVRIPCQYKEGMRAPGLIYVSEALQEQLLADQAPEQVANVACLPGIVGASIAMPDIHWGYGFPIGGVAAFDLQEGVVSPGGVGYDINCGVRLLAADLNDAELKPRLDKLLDCLGERIPAGVGAEGRTQLSLPEIEQVIQLGAVWAVERGYGARDDLDYTESGGRIAGADPAAVTQRACQRGAPQLGSLGGGNHFLEVQAVEEIYEAATAAAFGLHRVGQITFLIHTGSRGFGHQVCTDSLEIMQQAVRKYGISLPDRQLACAPLGSPEGKRYLAAMGAAVNFAWANRQLITHWVREAFQRTFRDSGLRVAVVYDVAHNVAKIEEHNVAGKTRSLCVHRKGATRAFPAGHPELPAAYRGVGQPVLVPGDMGRCSYVLVGTERAMAESFGSTCHGAGRMMSRSEAKQQVTAGALLARLREQGITVRAQNKKTLVEEAPEAYKDVTAVVEATVGAGLARKVARMRPIGVIKG
ncbi:MAG: RtcB family protein [bacterium]